jgi:NDP-sugar pyrophosphorylase family protein
MIELPITIVVLAAGKGTRLGNLTLAHSKAMTPIMGLPMIERVVKSFTHNGCKEFVVVGSPGDKQLINWAKAYNKNGAKVKLAFQKERKGTAHAVLMARDMIHQDFVITSCDNLYSDDHLSNLLTAHLYHRPPSVITISDFKPPQLDRSAGVKLNGSMVEEIVEKPGRDSKGWDAISKFLFTFRKDLLDCLDAVEPSPRGEYELQDAIRMFMDMSDEFSRAVKVDRFLDLTSPEDLIEIHRHYLKNHRACIIHPDAKVEPGVTMIHPVMIDKGAIVKSGAKIGPAVYVGKNAEIGESAVVENTVIYSNAKVKVNGKLSNAVVTK